MTMANEPTHDTIAERAVLGAALRSPAAATLAAGMLVPEDFWVPDHETVWKAILRLRRDKKPASVQAVTSALFAAGQHRLHLMPFELEAGCDSAEPEAVRHFAGIVRSYATRRRLVVAARQIIQKCENPGRDPFTLAAEAVTEMTRVRDFGDPDDITIRSLAEIMATEDDPYDWVIPGLLERGDRLVLTGGEGGGKSTMLRQIAICSAAGIHPFTHEPMDPCRVVLIDAENSERQFRRKSRGIVIQARTIGKDPSDSLFAEFPGRLDLTTERALSAVHKTLDAVQAHILIIGPLYKLSPKAIQTDDEATPLLVALDSIRDRGVALIMEAHAGHAQTGSGHRNWRPRGSSALLGWPEFGYGIEPDSEPSHARQIIMRPWRGDRDERDWPTYFRSGGIFPWTPIRTSDSNPAWRPTGGSQ